MLRALAAFILRGTSQATMVAAGAAVLAMVFPPVSLISGAAVALVTLRHGARAGLLVMLASTVVFGALAYFTLDDALAGLFLLGVLWLPVWAVAWVLRELHSLALAVVVAGGLAVIAIVFLHLWLGDMSGWWRELMLTIVEPALEAGGFASREMMQTLIEGISRIMTGIAATGIALSTLLSLFLGRSWQAILFNPGGFGAEFRELRLGRWLGVAALLVVLASLLPLDAVAVIADQVLIVLFALFVLQGLAVAHAGAARRKLHVAWLVALYVLALIVLPQLLALVAAVGLVDNWLDLRQRIPAKTD
jgi:hypothetical protein